MRDNVQKNTNEINSGAQFSREMSEIVNQNSLGRSNSSITKNDIRKAFAEVYDIIKNSEKDVQDRISHKFMNFLSSSMDTSYNVKIDYSKPLENQIQHETKVILGLIYRDYLCDSQTRVTLVKSEAEELERIEREKIEKYSVDNLFKNRNMNLGNRLEKNKMKEKEEHGMIEYHKKGFFEKIKGFFAKLLKK